LKISTSTQYPPSRSLHDALPICTYQNPPQEAWKRVKVRSDKPEVLAVLRGLAAWREEQAVSRDVPRSRILKDETLADIAMYKPRDRKSTRLNSSHVKNSYAVFCF